MSQTRTVHDPFLNQDVQVSDRLTDRLRGRYANGPTMPNGEPEFGWREFPTPPVQHEAAAEIDRLRRPFRAVDAQDWQYIASIIPDGGRGRFWKSVLAEIRVALETNSKTAA
jgi:hypothetical protein